MQEQRNIRLLILLGVLTAATLMTYFFLQDGDRAVVDPALFRAENLSKIDHVVLESKNKKVDLRFDGKRWKVNDRFDASAHLIDFLFATLEKAVPKHPVALHQRDSVYQRLDIFGTTVSLFEGSVLQMQFRAGGNASKTEAYFKTGKKSEAYLMAFPGYRAYVSQIFELDENVWRDKRIFNFNWRNFKTLTVKFPSDPASDFEIGKQGRFFGVIGLDKPDTAKVNTFLDDVSLLAADQIVVAGSSRVYDSLVKSTPLLAFEVRDIMDRSYRLVLFSGLRGDRYLIGKAFDGETVLFDRKKAFAIYKKRGYFKGK
jgi:hypothetical protein